MLVATLAYALLFAAIHLTIEQMEGLHGVPRNRWLSFCGGIAVTYVFLDILPELIEHNAVLAEASGAAEWLADHIVYLVALVGLAVFYGLERAVRVSRRKNRAATGSGRAPDAVFWIHIGSFAVYNLLIGYLLLHREVPGFVSLSLYAAALGVHVLTTDYSLWLHHKNLYNRRARWVLVGAVLAGWAAGAGLELPKASLGLISAFLAGGVIMNVMKDELPKEQDSRFSAFVAGIAFYTVVIFVS